MTNWKKYKASKKYDPDKMSKEMRFLLKKTYGKDYLKRPKVEGKAIRKAVKKVRSSPENNLQKVYERAKKSSDLI